MKRLIGILIASGCICFSSAYALIEVDPEHPFHFRQKVDGTEDTYVPFYLISKSAYRLLDEDTPWEAYIAEAKTKGFNSFRIWLMWPYYLENEGDDRCNEFRVWPWKYPALYDYPWYTEFSDAYWNRLRDVLRILKTEGIEVQLCIFDWGSLSRLPWNPEYPYDGSGEGTKFLYVDPELNNDPYPPPPDKRLKILLDKIISEARTWPDNWRLEIGNHISDPWNHHTWTPCVDSEAYPFFTGNMAPDFYEDAYQRKLYYQDWINSISSYLRRELDRKGLPNLVTHSSPNGYSDHQTGEETFWAKNYKWNQPIEFHGSRVSDWYVDNYNRYYRYIRKDAPPMAGRPVIDGEPKTYGFESGFSYANPDETRWNFYVGAMAGCYPTYHSVKARNLELNDDADAFIPAFSAIMQQGDIDLQTGDVLPTGWNEMIPDFDDVLIDQRQWISGPIGFSRTGSMDGKCIFPLFLKSETNNSAVSGFIYCLGNGKSDCIPDAAMFILDPDKFPGGSTCRFTWFCPDGSGPIEQFTQFMDPGSRYLRIPSSMVSRLNSSERDAIVHFKRVAESGTSQSKFKDNFTEARLLLNQTDYKPGDTFRLDLRSDLTVPDDYLFAELVIVLQVNGETFFYPDWKPGSFVSEPQFLKSVTQTILTFTWPKEYSGDAVTIDIIGAWIEPQQFTRNPMDLDNPGMVLMEPVRCVFGR